MHHPTNAVDKREEDEVHVDGSLRRPVGTAQRAPPAIRGGVIDDQEHVGQAENVW